MKTKYLIQNNKTNWQTTLREDMNDEN